MPVVVETFESRLLAGNPLGDSPTRRVPVYLPEVAAREPGRRFPLVFALAGFTGTGLSYLNYDFYSPNLPEMLDALIADGALPPCVVVMPDGMTRLGGNQYLDSSAVGPWQRHLCDELVPWAEGRFPCLGGPAHRAVFGKSSGGYGALMLALQRPGVFGAVASHSGDCYFDYCYLPDFPGAIDGLRRAGGLSRWLAGWRAHEKLPGWGFPVMEVVAMSAFYSPDAEAPHGFRLPFDEETGELCEAVFDRWRALDPVRLVASHGEALRGLRLLHLECGSRDEYRLHHGARLLDRRLSAAGIPHDYETFDDGHRGTAYRYKTTLPRLVRAVSA